MLEYILQAIFWIFALYGLIEVIKTILYIVTYTKQRSNGIYVIVAAKNQEDYIEGFMRTILFRLVYGKEEQIKEIILTDLESSDKTYEVAKKIEKDYENVKAIRWRECKTILDEIKE